MAKNEDKKKRDDEPTVTIRQTAEKITTIKGGIRSKDITFGCDRCGAAICTEGH